MSCQLCRVVFSMRRQKGMFMAILIIGIITGSPKIQGKLTSTVNAHRSQQAIM